MLLDTYEKQPVEVKDYDIDYRDWLRPMRDSIVAVKHHIRVERGSDTLAVDSSFFTGDLVKLWVSGGEDGDRFMVEVTVTTDGGRIDQSELRFRIKEI